MFQAYSNLFQWNLLGRIGKEVLEGYDYQSIFLVIWMYGCLGMVMYVLVLYG